MSLRPVHLPSDAIHPQRPPTFVELAHDTVLGLRREAAKREMTVARLAQDLLDMIASDGLVAAVLDVDDDVRPEP